MSILSVMFRSLKEMFWPRRFLPFFLLYFSILIAAFPIVASILSSLAFPTLAGTQFLLAGLVLLIVEFVILALMQIWFTSALVYDIKTKRGFSRGLRETKKLYLHMLLFFLVLGLMTGVVSYAGSLSVILNFIVLWFFAFTVPILIIERKSFDRAMSRSFELVRRKMLDTFVFWLVLNFTRIVILFFSIIFGTLILAPLIVGVISVQDLESLQYSTDYFTTVVSIFLSIFSNYPLAVSTIAVASLFVSIIHVFKYLGITYYFVEISRRGVKAKRRRKKGRR